MSTYIKFNFTFQNKPNLVGYAEVTKEERAEEALDKLEDYFIESMKGEGGALKIHRDLNSEISVVVSLKDVVYVELSIYQHE